MVLQTSACHRTSTLINVFLSFFFVHSVLNNFNSVTFNIRKAVTKTVKVKKKITASNNNKNTIQKRVATIKIVYETV